MSIVSKFIGMKKTLEKPKKRTKFFKFQNYDVEFYEKPILNNHLEKSINNLNQEHNFNYGIFSKKDNKYVLENSFLMLVFENKECIACFNIFHFLSGTESVCYQGIYLSLKKNNVFMTVLSYKMTQFVYDCISSHKIVSITNIPYVGYLLYSGFSNVFPHPKNMKKTSKENILIMHNFLEIVKKYFSEKDEKFDIFEKRSVLYIHNNKVSPKKLIDLPRAPFIEINAMFQFLIEDSQNETIIFIGHYNFITKITNLIKTTILNLKYQ